MDVTIVTRTEPVRPVAAGIVALRADVRTARRCVPCWATGATTPSSTGSVHARRRPGHPGCAPVASGSTSSSVPVRFSPVRAEPADHRVQPRRQPAFGYARTRSAASCCWRILSRHRFPGHDRAPVPHLRPHGDPGARRLDGDRADAGREARRGARRRHVTVEPHHSRDVARAVVPLLGNGTRWARASTSSAATSLPGTRST